MQLQYYFFFGSLQNANFGDTKIAPHFRADTIEIENANYYRTDFTDGTDLFF